MSICTSVYNKNNYNILIYWWSCGCHVDEIVKFLRLKIRYLGFKSYLHWWEGTCVAIRLTKNKRDRSSFPLDSLSPSGSLLVSQEKLSMDRTYHSCLSIAISRSLVKLVSKNARHIVYNSRKFIFFFSLMGTYLRRSCWGERRGGSHCGELLEATEWDFVFQLISWIWFE